MPMLINSNFKLYYNNDLKTCVWLFTLWIIALTLILPAYLVIYCRDKQILIKYYINIIDHWNEISYYYEQVSLEFEEQLIIYKTEEVRKIFFYYFIFK